METEYSRQQRLGRIRDLMTNSSISSQEELVEILVADGFVATQSAISRDLRELGVAKIQGFYALPENGPISIQSRPAGFELLISAVPAGSNLLILHTETGGASRVALALDQSAWDEVIGTIAGDDTIFVATADAESQTKLQQKLGVWTGGPEHD